MNTTMKRIRILGVVLAIGGLAVAGVGFGYGYPMANDGLDSAQAMYEEQGVMLTYNDAGQLVDRGTTEGAEKILALLEGDYAFPVNRDNLDPADPLVNTRDELMYQYATITYHVLHGTQDVTLTAEQVPITYRGVTYTEPGVYEIEVGEYYANLDRTHPIEGQLRAGWTAQALALTGTLAAGHANQAAGELALATTLGIGGIGLMFLAAGAGLVWASYGATGAPMTGRSREVTKEPARF